jgi:hypothetical protein
LNCFKLNGVPLYGTCNYPTKLSVQTKNCQSIILPNPAKEYFSIMDNDCYPETGFGLLEVFDSFGNRKVQINFEKRLLPLKILTNEFMAGLYFARIKWNEKVIYNQKIILGN